MLFLCRQLVVQYLYHRLVTELCPAGWQAGSAALSVDGSVSSWGSSGGLSAPSASSSSSSEKEDEESSCIVRLMDYLAADPDLGRLRCRQDDYFRQFSPWRACTVQGLLANGDEHHHFLHRPVLDQITSATPHTHPLTLPRTQLWKQAHQVLAFLLHSRMTRMSNACKILPRSTPAALASPFALSSHSLGSS